MSLKAGSMYTVCLGGWISCLLLLAPFAQAQEGYGNSDDPVAAEALGIEIRTSNPGEMVYVIKQILSVNYAKDHGLQATDAEVKQFTAMEKEFDTLARKDAQARQSEIEKALQAETLPETERKQLEGELELLEQLQQAAEAAEKQAGDSERAAAETQMARAIIGQWKVNKALYKQYGGRVIYQRGGAEPLDAYYKFLKQAQKEGDFKILNNDFESILWSYYTTDSKHKFYPENEQAQAINTAWWLMAPQSGQ